LPDSVRKSGAFAGKLGNCNDGWLAQHQALSIAPATEG